jgi:hypothetical protein
MDLAISDGLVPPSPADTAKLITKSRISSWRRHEQGVPPDAPVTNMDFPGTLRKARKQSPCTLPMTYRSNTWYCCLPIPTSACRRGKQGRNVEPWLALQPRSSRRAELSSKVFALEPHRPWRTVRADYSPLALRARPDWRSRLNPDLWNCRKAKPPATEGSAGSSPDLS